MLSLAWNFVLEKIPTIHVSLCIYVIVKKKLFIMIRVPMHIVQY